jgi:hypothetical protein
VDVVDAERCMLEEVSSLVVDLERVRVVELVEVEELVRYSSECNTNGYDPEAAGADRLLTNSG